MKIAVYPGSFDPVTLGPVSYTHLDVYKRQGDIFGLRQSGDMEFKLADIFTDANILKRVSEEVDRLLDLDPQLELEEHRELKRKIEDYLGTNYEKLNL